MFHCPVRKLVSAIGNKGMSLVSLLVMHQENTQSILQWGYLRESVLYTVSVFGRWALLDRNIFVQSLHAW